MPDFNEYELRPSYTWNSPNVNGTVHADRALFCFLAPCANAGILPCSLVSISIRLSYSFNGEDTSIIPVSVTISLNPALHILAEPALVTANRWICQNMMQFLQCSYKPLFPAWLLLPVYYLPYYVPHLPHCCGILSNLQPCLKRQIYPSNLSLPCHHHTFPQPGIQDRISASPCLAMPVP